MPPPSPLAPLPAAPRSSRARVRSGPWLPWAVLAGSLLLTFALTCWSLAEAAARREARFQAAAQAVVDRLETRMEAHVGLLRGATGLFVGSEDVTRAEFEGYVAQLLLAQRYPGLRGVGYSPRVRPGQEAALVARARAQGLEGFHLWPERAPDSARFTILYLEPLDARNRAALGFDMSSEPTRAEAMARARETGQPALSGKVELKQEIDGDKQPGFLLYLPLYVGVGAGAAPERLQGYVFAPFRAGDFFERLFSEAARSPVGFEVYDGARVDPQALLYASAPGEPHEGPYAQVRRVTLAGRPWTLAFHARPGYLSFAERAVRPVLGVLGVLASLALFALTRARAREWARAEFEQQLIGIVSHDLRTPLSAIGMSASSLLGSQNLDPRQQRALARILSSSARANRMIEALLDFTRARLGGGIPLTPRPCELREVVRRAVDEARAAHPGRALSLACEGDLQGEWDPERLEQALGNLLGNALRHGDPGSPVQVHAAQEGEAVRLAVHNRGSPIPPEKLPGLFEPFEVGSPQSTAKGGLGLGLFIVKEIARSHGGRVEVRSTAQEGTTFTVHLPRRAPPSG